ncbi:MAG: site-specific integrase, partial [Ruminococcus sp.]|nr:site-specific integrase [Ruminococcus sp.]
KYDKLGADGLNGFISQKLAGKLSPKYVADIVLIIKSAAKFAQRRYGYANRVESVTMPKSQSRREQKMLTDDEQAQLKSELLARPNSSNIGILLAAATGLRIGELCALRWRDVDLEKSFLTVRSTVQRIMQSGGGTRLIVTSPKSGTSKREIPLPDFIIPYLKAVRAADDCFLLSGSEKIVEPRTMQYRFKSLLKRANLPYVNFHALRHMFATNCIALGFDVKTLSELLGHSSVQITLNRYVHSSMERKRLCMKMFSDSLAAA